MKKACRIGYVHSTCSTLLNYIPRKSRNLKITPMGYRKTPKEEGICFTRGRKAKHSYNSNTTFTSEKSKNFNSNTTFRKKQEFAKF